MNEIETLFPNLKRVLDDYGNAFVKHYRDILDEEGINATRNLWRSIRFEPVLEGESISIDIILPGYSEYLENGTGPGHIPDKREKFWPPISAIRDWVDNKPGVPKDDSFAYAVQGKIHNEGTEAKQVFKRTVEYMEQSPEWQERISEAIDRDLGDSVFRYILGSLNL